jgi:hypothetical protein
MPLKGTRIIPAAWSAHHQPTAEATMTATVTITRPSTAAAVLDDATGDITRPDPTVLATETPARIQAAAASDRVTPAAGQQVTQRDYLVTLPLSVAALEVDDVITVVTANDPHLPGRILRVTDVVHGSEVWERDVFCSDDLG